MDWNKSIEEAKEDLGISGWTDNWNEVIKLAKEKYWGGKNFKQLKEITLEESNYECLLCGSNNKLTAHHIFYSGYNETICVCKECHNIIHQLQKKYGFIIQITLKYWDNFYKIMEEFPNLYEMCLKCNHKIVGKLNDEVKNDEKR